MLGRPATFDLDEPRFEAACRRLADTTREFQPDVVVGIATGGARVAHLLAPHLDDSPVVAEVALRRPSTEVKERIDIGRVLRRLPTPLRNLLRWAEVELRELALRRRPAPPPNAGESAAGDGFGIALGSADRVLVVDDTVDSGRTLRTAVDVVRAHRPQAEVRTAVLTSTFRQPPVRADYALYDRTLLRFPWSFDV